MNYGLLYLAIKHNPSCQVNIFTLYTRSVVYTCR